MKCWTDLSLLFWMYKHFFFRTSFASTRQWKELRMVSNLKPWIVTWKAVVGPTHVESVQSKTELANVRQQQINLIFCNVAWNVGCILCVLSGRFYTQSNMDHPSLPRKLGISLCFVNPTWRMSKVCEILFYQRRGERRLSPAIHYLTDLIALI